MKPEEIYEKWRDGLKSPDDSLFYYHPGLERILLGLAIFTISSKQIFDKLGKQEPLSVLNIYVNKLVTAWIEEDDEAFETMFRLTMPVAEAFMICVFATKKQHPSKAKNLMKLAHLFSYAVALGGDMNQESADELLDDLTTDGKRISSLKIKEFGNKLLKLIQIHGPELSASLLSELG